MTTRGFEREEFNLVVLGMVMREREEERKGEIAEVIPRWFVRLRRPCQPTEFDLSIVYNLQTIVGRGINLAGRV